MSEKTKYLTENLSVNQLKLCSLYKTGRIEIIKDMDLGYRIRIHWILFEKDEQ